MAKLGEIARYVRSKNAGPFWVTIDIFCPDPESFQRISEAPELTARAIAALYGISENGIHRFRVPSLHVLKISFPRPTAQGSPGDADSHAGQLFVPLLSVEIDQKS
ncbi:hypothetical protein GGQ88_001950 [Novosphingobium hassiacum]|uniref:DUF4387 domain-containing protein n=1 Tax=Novosphingobium hassiacum TaxID=173676 RepID=A0A7W5ZWA1_9SPHN|nr:hypothetical protein [Novosphingobium hassiacum]